MFARTEQIYPHQSFVPTSVQTFLARVTEWKELAVVFDSHKMETSALLLIDAQVRTKEKQ